jgi:hypothetical protein
VGVLKQVFPAGWAKALWRYAIAAVRGDVRAAMPRARWYAAVDLVKARNRYIQLYKKVVDGKTAVMKAELDLPTTCMTPTELTLEERSELLR